MRFSLSTFLLGCGLQVAAGAAVEARAPPALTCTEGPRVANFNDVPALPAEMINRGVVSGFNPHYDVNYTHFGVGTIALNDNALFHKLTIDPIQPGPWQWWQRNLNSLIGVRGRMPPRLVAPSMLGAAPQTRLRLRNLRFGCAIRQGTNPAVHFDCALVVVPLEPKLYNDYHVCNYDSKSANEDPALYGLQDCTLPSDKSWTVGRGFSFRTFGRVQSPDWFAQHANLFNTTLPGALLLAMDDIHYTEYCTDDGPVA
ncbi:hypothetical protein G7054_g11192 [Neopestalotiopsis clavispora]|nr:hypothetical protein G7054_g11192 [Neopestalotiopsis clavispora]